ncbi:MULTISPECIES: SGNH/GDSL hydrolase family protein [Catenuloplanes]|uniref:Lysophospholipase L1-like esterase n=1 Tax=Catenuloplanes niger TaxID=587534 RepID=A0AAE3ZIT3_9ACTN|nr:SGNH/GDSL hydrolase family protein [Catenuloplanes niger]MDR7320673.1 lysophospholipase L1-like esterase [Catenuloplanes niger]
MRRRPSLFAAAVLTVAAVGVLGAAPAGAAAGGFRYVALGDSYSSGVGNPPYSEATCKRSTAAYPVRFAAEQGVRLYSFAACSGATTQSVAGQLKTLGRFTRQVTVTVGGNDVGFGTGVAICLQGTDADCLAAAQASNTTATTVLPGRLDALFASIRAAAPHADVVVAGYPRFFELTDACATAPLNLTRRTVMNAGADVLNGVLADRAGAAGFAFADVRPAFDGHGVCGADPWINGIVADGALHPNAAGHVLGYLPGVREAFRTA